MNPEDSVFESRQTKSWEKRNMFLFGSSNKTVGLHVSEPNKNVVYCYKYAELTVEY